MRIKTGKYLVRNTTIIELNKKLEPLMSDDFNPETVDSVRKIELNIRVRKATVNGSRGDAVVKTYIELIQDGQDVYLVLYSDLMQSILASFVLGAIMMVGGVILTSSYLGAGVFAMICLLATFFLQLGNSYTASRNLIEELKENYL